MIVSIIKNLKDREEKYGRNKGLLFRMIREIVFNREGSMKRLLHSIILVTMVTTQLVTAATKNQSCSVPCPVSCNVIDNIVVSVGDEFYIDRPVSGGIGFKWDPVVSPKHQGYIQYLGKNLNGQSSASQGTSRKMMGGTKNDRFHFKALRSLIPGARAIRFTRWYRGNADETCDVMVTIND